MTRLNGRRLRAMALLGFAISGVSALLPGCGDGTGNPPVGSISSPKQGSDSEPEKSPDPKAAAPRGRVGGDR